MTLNVKTRKDGDSRSSNEYVQWLQTPNQRMTMTLNAKQNNGSKHQTKKGDDLKCMNGYEKRL